MQDQTPTKYAYEYALKKVSLLSFKNALKNTK